MIVLGIVAVAVVLMLLGASQSGQPVGRLSVYRPRVDEPEPDQLEMLQRYGTPEDAARLMAQGVDLTALGYQPPEQS